MATNVTDLPAQTTFDGTNVIACENSAGEARKITLGDMYVDRSGFINVTDYGAVADGTTDCTTAFTNAFAAAVTAGTGVYVPPTPGPVNSGDLGRTYLITSTVTVSAPLVGQFGGQEIRDSDAANVPASVITTNISNGTPVFKRTAAAGGGNSYYISDIFIHTGNGLPSPQNCIGFQLGQSAVPIETGASNWGYLWNCRVWGCSVGFDIHGWTSRIKIDIRNCDTGLRASYLNRCLLDVACHNNEKPLELTNCDSVIFERFDAEGSSENTPSTIDSSSCVTILNWGQERAGGSTGKTTPWLQVGFTAICRNFYILAGTLSSIGPDTGTSQTPLIELDRVDHWYVNLKMQNTNNHSFLRTSHRTRFRMMPPALTHYTFHHTEEATSAGGRLPDRTEMSFARNVLPNPFFSGGTSGAKSTTLTNCTMAYDSTAGASRHQHGALKITGTSAGGPCTVVWVFEDPDMIQVLRNGMWSIGMWLYVPNTAGYARTDGTAWPRLQARGYSGASYTTPIHSGAMFNTSTGEDLAGHYAGGWNFIFAESTGSSTWHLRTNEQSIEVTLDLNAAGGTTDYVILDSMFVCPGHVAYQMQNSNIIHSQPMGTWSGRLDLMTTQAVATSIKADANQTFQVGDRIRYKDVAAGGAEGEVFTASGWKTMGSISA